MLGQKIKAYLDANGIKQTFICEKTNINKSAFTAILAGTRKIEAVEYYKICQALNVDMLTFMTDAESEN